MATRQKNKRSRGFTLAEMLLASSVAALTATAGASLIYAASAASASTSDLRTEKNSGRILVSRLSADVRQARAIGGVGTDRLVLWQEDVNGDDQINANELRLIRWDSGTKRVVREYIAMADETDVGAVVDKNTFFSTADVATLIAAGDKRTAVVGESIEGFGLRAYPESGETSIVDVKVAVKSGDDRLVFRKSMSPRASADYLFDSATRIDPKSSGDRVKRRYYSRWSGFSDVRATAAPAVN